MECVTVRQCFCTQPRTDPRVTDQVLREQNTPRTHEYRTGFRYWIGTAGRAQNGDKKVIPDCAASLLCTRFGSARRSRKETHKRAPVRHHTVQLLGCCVCSMFHMRDTCCRAVHEHDLRHLTTMSTAQPTPIFSHAHGKTPICGPGRCGGNPAAAASVQARHHGASPTQTAHLGASLHGLRRLALRRFRHLDPQWLSHVYILRIQFEPTRVSIPCSADL
jgi:hypothetical protein